MWGITSNSVGSGANPGAIYPGYWGLSGAHQAPEGLDRTPGSRYKSGMRTVILRLGDREVQALGKTPEFWRAVVRKNVRSLPRSKFWARRSPLSKWSSRIGGMRQAISGGIGPNDGCANVSLRTPGLNGVTPGSRRYISVSLRSKPHPRGRRRHHARTGRDMPPAGD
jgi:hypothetical protein